MSSIRDPRSKVMELAAASEHLRQRRSQGAEVVFTNGCFDLLHAGHARLLHDARALGDLLVVAINSDASIRRLKGASRPIVPEGERALLLAHLEAVDVVVVFDEDTPLATLDVLRPNVLVKGGDYVPDTVVGRDEVEAYGGRVAIVPLVEGWSTSEIIQRIQAEN